MVSVWRGAITGLLRKQNIYGKSSNKYELIGVDDTLSQILWSKYFVEAQGYTAEQIFIYQDNNSVILIENYGKS